MKTRARRSQALLTAALMLGACSGPEPQGRGAGAQDAARKAVDWRFVGDASFHDFELRRVVEDQLIDYERRGEVATLYDASLDLQDHYTSEGFPNARVQYEVEEDAEAKRTRVTFAIEEGPRAYVVDVRLEGAKSFPQDELLQLWSRKRSGLLATGNPYFVAANLRAFRYSMLGYYRDRGFLDVAIEGPESQAVEGGDKERVDMRVRFAITEGPPAQLAEVTIDEALAKALAEGGAPDASKLVGERFRPPELAAYRERVRQALQDSGYPEAELRTRRDVDRNDAEQTVVRARILGQPGPRRRIREVRIRGNARTARRVIEARLRFEAGQYYNASKVEATLRELYTSGLFSRVTVERAETNNPDGDILEVVVEEVAAREFGVLVGYGSYERARTKVVLADRNLFGIGQSLRLSGKLSERSYGTELTFTEPRIFGTSTSWVTTGFFREREEPSFVDESLGVSSVFMRRLFRGCQARAGYAIEDRDGSDIDASLRSLVLEEFVVAKLFGELRYDDRDSSIAPRDGWRAMLRYEFASPELGGDLRFDRVTTDAAWHLPLTKGVVFSVAARAGAIWARDSAALPVQERFFRGGDTTVRSFREAELGPRTASGRPAGGEFFTNFNAELRFPLAGPFEGAVFADAANVGRDVSAFGLSDMRYGVGGGLRFLLPIGPVRVDYAWNPDARDYERDTVFHLSVGYPF